MRRFLRFAKISLAVLGAAFVIGAATPAEAQRGGRFGGSGFSGGSRGFSGGSSGYRGGYGGGGGYRGYYGGGSYYHYRPGWGYGYWGGTYGYRPYSFWGYPSYSVGAVGGLVFLAILGGLIAAVVIVNRRRQLLGGRSVGYGYGYNPYEDQFGPAEEPVQVIKTQLALLATARHVQQDLERVATTGDTTSPQGLAALLRESAILLAREQPYWKAGFIGQETFDQSPDAERRFEEAVAGERVKLDGESVSNEQGRSFRSPTTPPEDPHKVGRYIVVTMLVAVSGTLLDDNHTPSIEEMSAALTRLAGTPGAQLRALEVIWAPSDPNGALDEDDMIMKYSALSTF